MKLALRAAAAASAGGLVILISGVPTRATNTAAPVLAALSQRNDAISSFTFHANIAMAMHHFPWLHFHLAGTGDYVRGDHYLLHLTNGPPFASKMHDIDLSMIDPSLWPGRYRYTPDGQSNGDTLFALQSARDNSVKSATVAINPLTGPHWVDVTYTEGTHIHMVVSSNNVDGYLLPVSLTADVDCPHMPLTADAAFSDYSITAPVHEDH
ncbi:MAG: hypothetical protein JOY69_03765 [Candidatus Eremiobacteraeota bacterium]|nr:hypothetical protein [Candidatus Eremiobacteraeota bacterium]